ncbi:hypothetical protein RJ640_008846 [Escallonia rubra]|uniref:RBR-type E3 ubiquitin transferase n=1 Tax=Escallonia rubra TaxID=112253 RepID=A0AA88RBD9_9ASTE|nr:hypothetical protein RJ640_008846 [Escallonia rubra]
MDADEDTYFSDGSYDETVYSENGDAADYTFDEYNDRDVDANPQERNYTVLSEEDIKRRVDDLTSEISTLLSVSRVAACLLLYRYNWSPTNVHEAWFSDEEGVREAVGLLERPPRAGSDQGTMFCSICLESYPPDEVESTAYCVHTYCVTCWQAYISTSIADGLGCLSLKCPDPSCNAAVGQDVVDLLALEEDKRKYHRFIVRSYVENSKKAKWCPAPGCEFAVQYDASGEGGYDVTCLCSHSFCWNCTEESHRPLDCDTVVKWMLKNKDEGSNTEWLLANTKPCPSCKRPIEKIDGCMHMACKPPCHFEFCWLCLGPSHGHTMTCNRYDEKDHTEEETRRGMAKSILERYTHYYERWAANLNSRRKAIADLHLMETEQLKILSKNVNLPETQLKFVIDAWLQIIECRRVLTWTYAYGYYLPEGELAKKQFFEYLQGEAEVSLERLHQCMEKGQKKYLNFNQAYPDCGIFEFREELLRLTSVTRIYFENLVTALENGLSDVDETRWMCDHCTHLNIKSAAT